MILTIVSLIQRMIRDLSEYMWPQENRLADHPGLRWRRGREHGFTYIAVMLLVAIMGVLLVMTAQVLSTATRREKELELIFVGDQFRNAIKLYNKNSAGQSQRYPMNLEDLLRDPRYPDIRRYLRKIHLDPVKNSVEWGLVKGPSGEVLGVHSLSGEEPLKKTNFSLADKDFEGKMKYSDWVFMIAVQQGPTQQAPARQTQPSSQ